LNAMKRPWNSIQSSKKPKGLKMTVCSECKIDKLKIRGC
jgi:hypothetical protein